MGILALYDTVSIQSFIYNSNRLRDNRGASLLVEDCFQQVLKMAIYHVLGNSELVRWNWRENLKKADFIDDGNIKCEIIYMGGGNALLYLENVELYRSINTEFSRKLLTEIPGIVVVSDYVEMKNQVNDFGSLVDELFCKLQMKKMRHRGMECAPAMSVTRECSYTRKPAVTLAWDGSWIGEELEQKRERAKGESEAETYKEIDDLSGQDGEQWVATVHIDGNAMGEHMQTLLKKKNISEGTETLRKFSLGIHKVYQDAYDAMINSLQKLIQNVEDFRILEKYKIELPFRKIYSAGDDVTFVCYGPFAIKAAELYLREIQKQEILGIRLSACAGIAYTKPGYPFFKAYQMAEQCCKNAKGKARKHMQDNQMGSYLDFQVVRGTLSNLADVRAREYCMDAGHGQIFSMLLRPYAILENHKVCSYRMKRDDLQFFYNISNFLHRNVQAQSIARSKIKELRNAYCEDVSSAKKSVELIRRRYPEQLEALERIIQERESGVKTPYIDSDGKVVLWDALEMLDLYIRL